MNAPAGRRRALRAVTAAALPLLVVASAQAATAAGRPTGAAPSASAALGMAHVGGSLAAALPGAVPPCDPKASSLRPSGPPQVTLGSFMATIRARGHLIAGVDQNSYHFSYLNPLDGQIEGFDIDMLHAISQAIFANPDKIQFKAISDAARIPAVRSGSVDIVADSMTITCARLQLVSFSTVYFDAGQRLLVQKNSSIRSTADLGGKRVCATPGTTSIANLAALPSHPVPVAVTYWTDCLVLLQQAQVAAISTDDSILAGLAAQDPTTVMVGPRFTDEPYGLAISQQHPDFVRFVNAVLAQVRGDGRWAASYARWVGTPVPAPPPARYSG